MNKYTIYCTEPQTKKALELGAPLEKIGISQRDSSRPAYYIDDPEKNLECDAYYCPTAEQMIGWLEERDIYINILWDDTLYIVIVYATDKGRIAGSKEGIYYSRKEVTLAAIDVSLEYLKKSSNK